MLLEAGPLGDARVMRVESPPQWDLCPRKRPHSAPLTPRRVRTLQEDAACEPRRGSSPPQTQDPQGPHLGLPAPGAVRTQRL